MKRRFWRVDNDNFLWRQSSFRLQTAICFITILTTLVLLRIANVFWATSARCVEADQFWFENYQSDWPLGGTFFLVFFLLVVWNLVIAVSQFLRGIQDWFLPVVNLIAIAAVFSLVGPATDSAQMQFYDREKIFGEWHKPRSGYWYGYQDRCVVARDYLGKWNVVSRSTVNRGSYFPSTWIDFKQNLSFRSEVTSEQRPYEGRWIPPRRSSTVPFENTSSGTLRFESGYEYWNFAIIDEQLVLSSPTWELEQYGYSEVVLQRDLDK